jgi:transposase
MDFQYEINDEESNEVYISLFDNENEQNELNRVDEDILMDLQDDDAPMDQMTARGSNSSLANDFESDDIQVRLDNFATIVAAPHLTEQNSSRKRKRDDYRVYTKSQVVKFIGMTIEQVPVKIAASKTGIVPSTAYRFRQQWNKNGCLMEKRPKGPQKSKGLTDEHAAFVVDLVDTFPAITLDQMRLKLLSRFPGLALSKTSFYRFVRTECVLSMKKIEKHVESRSSDATIEKRKAKVEEWLQDADMDFMKNCVFLDEAGFNLHLSRTRGWSPKGSRCVIEVPNSKGSNITILGAMTANEVIDVAIRKPTIVQCKKRKLADGTDVTIRGKVGTRKEHFKDYLRGIMDKLDKKGMKGFYLVMDNAPIHRPKDIEELITNRGYKCVYLPPYSPFLNPIEEMWSKVKGLVRRAPFDSKDTLTPRILRATNLVTVTDLQGWVRHSVSFFQRCLNGERKL